MRLVVVHVDRSNREADLALLLRHLDDLHAIGVADHELVLGFFDALVIDFRDVQETFDPLLDLDEGSEIREPDHFAVHDIAFLMTVEELFPRVLAHLLQTERKALVLGVDVQNESVDSVAFFENFRGMAYALVPAHVGDVDEAVDTIRHFDEEAEIGKVSYCALDARTGLIFLRELLPRVRLDLFETEADAALLAVDLENHGFDFVADREYFRRVLHALAPRHLGDVDEALDAGLELDESAVIGEADDFAFDPLAGGKAPGKTSTG